MLNIKILNMHIRNPNLIHKHYLLHAASIVQLKNNSLTLAP